MTYNSMGVYPEKKFKNKLMTKPNPSLQFFSLIVVLLILLFAGPGGLRNGYALQLTPAPDAKYQKAESFIETQYDDLNFSRESSTQLLVKFNNKLSTFRTQAILGKAKLTHANELEKIGINLVTVSPGEKEKILSDLKNNPDVIFAEPNYSAQAQETIPNDPDYADQDNLVNIHASAGWDINSGSSSVIIAIVDTGIDLNHEDLQGKIISGYDFVQDDTSPQDLNGHGTHVAGIAAAITNNSKGIAGIDWGAQIMPVRVLDAGGDGSYADVASGIIWAADHGAKVINLSLGGSSYSSTLENAVNYAAAKNAVIVAASGNSGSNKIIYPARFEHVIAVGSTDSSNHLAYFSNYGPELDLTAPGVNILSTWPSNQYRLDSGTSMSTPQVSGLAGILIGIPGSTPGSVESKMKSTALDLGEKGRDDFYGSGLIQMNRALNAGLAGSVKKLPNTGFSPRFQSTTRQPLELSYTDFEIELEIPSIKFKTAVVGVPEVSEDWNLAWLGKKAGWLEGSAFPTWKGNSVITGHVWNEDNSSGPFIGIKNLKYGEIIRLNAWGQVYTYQVRSNELVKPADAGSAFQHEEQSWITLITCEGYDQTADAYRSRRIVRAILVEVNSK